MKFCECKYRTLRLCTGLGMQGRDGSTWSEYNGFEFSHQSSVSCMPIIVALISFSNSCSFTWGFDPVSVVFVPRILNLPPKIQMILCWLTSESCWSMSHLQRLGFDRHDEIGRSPDQDHAYYRKVGGIKEAVSSIKIMLMSNINQVYSHLAKHSAKFNGITCQSQVLWFVWHHLLIRKEWNTEVNLPNW